MVWTVIWSKKSVKQLKKLGKNIARRIRDRVLEITDDPYKATKRLVNKELYSLRVGDYRVIMDLKREQLIIFVVSASHRKESYDF
ncbi:MAG: type II toxin-antitoxin system RelE family toxin [Nitrosopumilaceae archaeon]